ncbi:MAG: hypothetical protein Q9207_008446 [Kuettlingeria erythrocarpa]
MSPKRKESGFADTADMAMSESEEAGPVMVSPSGPDPKRTRLDTSAGLETGGEEVSPDSAVPSPPNNLPAQGFSAEAMDAGPSQTPHPPSYTSVEPDLLDFIKGKEKEEELPEDSGHFPICICIRQAIPFFMLANSNWSMERFQQEIMTAVESHGNAQSLNLLINSGFGQLTVVWESERRKAFLNNEFPSFTAIGDHNIQATLEFLKRKRSDVVVVDFGPFSDVVFERYMQSDAGSTNA